MFLRESDRRSYGMCRYSVSLITAGACKASFSEWSMCPLCSSMRATPLKIITTARRSVHTLMGSKEAFRTSTRAFMIEADITRGGRKVSKDWPLGVGSVRLWHAHLERDSRAGRPCHSFKLTHYRLRG